MGKVITNLANEVVGGIGSSFSGALGELDSMTSKYISLEEIIPRVTDLFVGEASSIRLLNKELGASGEVSARLRKEIATVSKEIGIASREQIELISSTKEFHRTLSGDTTKAVLQFSKAAGISADSIGNMIAKMSFLGNVSDSTMDRMLTTILAVREEYGLTSDQIEQVTSTLSKYAVVTSASTINMERAAETVAKFTSNLTSAGIEADKVAEILDNMIDPNRLTDNLMLMSRMGISINDMVSGDPLSKVEGSVEKLRDLGNEIKSIASTNRFAANELAKVYGLTLSQALQLSELNTDPKALDYDKRLSDYRKEMNTFADNIKNFFTIVGGTMSRFFAPFSAAIEKFGSTLSLFPAAVTSFVVAVTGRKIFTTISNKLKEAAGEAAKYFGVKAGSAMSEQLKQSSSRLSARQSDAAALTPNISTYGEYSSRIRRAMDYEDKKRAYSIQKGKTENFSVNEAIEVLNAQRAAENSIINQYNNSTNEVEKRYLQRRYNLEVNGNGTVNRRNSVLDTINDKSFSNIMGEASSVLNTSSGTYYKKFKSAFGGADSSMFGDSLNGLFGNDEFKNAKSYELEGLSKTLLGASGAEEFIKALGEFVEKHGNSAESIKMLKEAEVQLNKSREANINTIQQEIRENAKRLAGPSKIRGWLGDIKDTSGILLQRTFGIFTGGFKKLLTGLGIGTAGSLLLSSVVRSQKVQEALGKIGEAVAPVVESVSETLASIIEFITPAIEKVAGLLDGPLTFISKNVKKISSSVDFIANNEYDGDLKEMALGYATYDSLNNNMILTRIEAAVGEVTEALKDSAAVAIQIAK